MTLLLSLEPVTISTLSREVAAQLKPQLDHIFRQLANLEALLSKADDKITAFAADTATKLTALGSALDNIAADEKAQKDQIDALIAGQDLSPASTAALQSVSDSLGAMATRTQALADSIPDTPPIA